MLPIENLASIFKTVSLEVYVDHRSEGVSTKVSLIASKNLILGRE